MIQVDTIGLIKALELARGSGLARTWISQMHGCRLLSKTLLRTELLED